MALSHGILNMLRIMESIDAMGCHDGIVRLLQSLMLRPAGRLECKPRGHLVVGFDTNHHLRRPSTAGLLTHLPRGCYLVPSGQTKAISPHLVLAITGGSSIRMGGGLPVQLLQCGLRRCRPL
jgi:hypothetical protein